MAEVASKYKDVFLSEAKEHILAMESALLELEKTPAKMEFANNIFRETHTLKSMAATMDYSEMSALCHAIENVLDAVKKKKIKPDKCFDILFECFDVLKAGLREISQNKEEPKTSALVEKLQTLIMQKQDTSKSMLSVKAPAIERIESVEIKVEKLDMLMNLAEELLINKMRLDGIKEEIQNPELTAAVDALSRLVSEIQFNIMQSRMVPIGFVFNRFPRMVRDLAKSQKKEVTLNMEGSDIELDRTVIEEIGETLVHLLRNAVDHGIETSEERKKTGKPSQAKISLSAVRTKDSVVISISDDGGGLDIEDIKSKAVQRGVLSPQAGKAEIINSIFFGVSTTKQVTAVSGRGFGLDIVKNKIDSLGGTVKVDSEPKKGTTFVMEIPLTLAIIKVLFIEVEGENYAIPLTNIERLVAVDREDIKGMLGGEAIVLEEEDIPITRLDVLFGTFKNENLERISNERNNPDENRNASPDNIEQTSDKVGTYTLEKETQKIAIVRKGEERLGLAVNAFLTTQEIVIKPLSRLVRENRYFAGSTIIGSGEVVLILDVANLVLTKRESPLIENANSR